MKKIKILTSIIFLLSTFSGYGQFKVVESSERRAPDWINSLQRDYIVVSAEGSSIQEAQQNALLFIKERIVSSVADNVKATSELTTEETNFNNNVNNFLQNYTAKITTHSGDIPYLQGISLSKAQDYYWEKLFDKKAGVTKYNYHVLYPFPDIELQKLVMDFNIRQRELNEQLSKLINAIDRVNTIEEINANIIELQTLSEMFMDGRKERAIGTIKRYREMLNSMTLIETNSKKGELRFRIEGAGRIFTTSQKPKSRSECARITATKPEGMEWVIHYDTEYCYDDPENHIEVSFRFGAKPTTNKFYFNTNEDVLKVSVRDDILFEALEKEENKVVSSNIKITIYNEHNTPFIVENVTLSFEDCPPITVRNINKRFNGPGNHYLSLTVNEDIDTMKSTSVGKTVARISGSMNIRSLKDNTSQTVKIFNQPYTTNW